MDLPRIKLGSRQCECRVISLDHRPHKFCTKTILVGVPGIGLASRRAVALLGLATDSQFLAGARNIAPSFDSLAPRATLANFILLLYLSGCRESNPDLTLPKRVYYHYTTPRTMLVSQNIFCAYVKRWTQYTILRTALKATYLASGSTTSLLPSYRKPLKIYHLSHPQ